MSFLICLIYSKEMYFSQLLLELTFFKRLVVADDIRVSQLFADDVEFTDEITNTLVPFLGVLAHFWHQGIDLKKTKSEQP